MKKFLFLFFVFFGIFGFLNFSNAAEYNCNGSQKCVDVQGYLWGADNGTNPPGGIGWINLNNTSSGSDTANGADYKVTFNRDTWEFTGYAYSENYGYIKFGGLSNFPSGNEACVTNVKGGDDCDVHMIKNTNGSYEMVGYARFCFVYETGCSGTLKPSNELGGFDGWIGFKGTNFSITYSTSTNSFQGYAWGGGSGDPNNSEYGQGVGWIKFISRVSCDVSTGKDCLSDNSKPIVTLTATPSKPNYTQDVTIDWDITGVASCDTVTVYSSPANTNWDNTAISNLSDNKNIGTLSGTPNIFGLTCTKGTETGTAEVLVELDYSSPIITLSAPTSVNYDDDVTLTYSISNAPYGCNATLYKNGVVEQSFTGNNGNGTLNVVDLKVTTQWELWCEDVTPPSPSRTGRSGVKTTSVIVSNPVMSLNVVDNGTNDPNEITCTNTGAKITYSVSNAYPNSCVAKVNGSTSVSGWGNSTTIIQDGTSHTSTTGAVTQTGNILYSLTCMKIDGITPFTAGDTITRDCNLAPGSLSVTASKACYETSENIDIHYIGSKLEANSCQKNWTDTGWTGDQSNFDNHYQFPAGMIGVGNHSYTMSNCIEEDYPTNPPLSSTATIEIANVCTNCTDPCDPNCPNYTSSHRCAPLKGPKIKEQ